MTARIYVGLILAVSLLAPTAPGSATTLLITCRDGESPAVIRVGRFGLGGGVIGSRRGTTPVCDFDATCDERCTFAFCSLDQFLCANHPVCVGPGSGVCQPGSEPLNAFVVPAGKREVLPAAGFGFDVILRCRRSPSCR